MPRTRSAPPPKQSSSSEQKPQSEASKTPVKPSKSFILPSSASADARFVTLPNPRTGDSMRYFFCPQLGVYEFTIVASQFPRSTLYTSTNGEGEDTKSQGSISKTAELLVATPIDILFFAIPLLTSSRSSDEGKRLFQPLDDIIDSHDELPKHIRDILYNLTFRDTLLRRIEAVCDSVEAGDEKMFRVSEAKLVKELLTKAERMAANGLPKSLEERFVKQILAVPLVSVARTDIATSLTTPKEEETGAESQENKDTQSTAGTTSADSISGTSTPAPDTPLTPAGDELPGQTCPEPIVRLQRLSTALTFLKTSYISPDVCTKIDELLAAPESPIDFKPLQAHLKHLADLRVEALASRSLGDFSRKRNAEDEDAADSRAEKKRRMEEEEKKKKAGESRGVRELKKVNTTGMKKMSDFFGKAAAKKKS
ncbi:ribonuclease H2, subunit B [Aspergillus venezuelensis]